MNEYLSFECDEECSSTKECRNKFGFRDVSSGYESCEELDQAKYKFKVGARNVFSNEQSQENNDESIDYDVPGAIECYLFKNSHLTVTIKILNTSDIPAYDVIEMIRQPEQIDQDKSHRSGVLVREAERLIGCVEKKIEILLKENNVRKIELGKKLIKPHCITENIPGKRKRKKITECKLIRSIP
ncbi:MAG: hypothetical protein GXO85_12135 [Chlorobi bacterium]|nr:hypothetical protein [Chlorobiota bacterium]